MAISFFVRLNYKIPSFSLPCPPVPNRQILHKKKRGTDIPLL